MIVGMFTVLIVAMIVDNLVNVYSVDCGDDCGNDCGNDCGQFGQFGQFGKF